MKKAELAIPEIMLIAGTRVMLGAGCALLLSDQLEKGSEKRLGGRYFDWGDQHDSIGYGCVEQEKVTATIRITEQWGSGLEV